MLVASHTIAIEAKGFVEALEADLGGSQPYLDEADEDNVDLATPDDGVVAALIESSSTHRPPSVLVGSGGPGAHAPQALPTPLAPGTTPAARSAAGTSAASNGPALGVSVGVGSAPGTALTAAPRTQPRRSLRRRPRVRKRRLVLDDAGEGGGSATGGHDAATGGGDAGSASMAGRVRTSSARRFGVGVGVPTGGPWARRFRTRRRSVGSTAGNDATPVVGAGVLAMTERVGVTASSSKRADDVEQGDSGQGSSPPEDIVGLLQQVRRRSVVMCGEAPQLSGLRRVRVWELAVFSWRNR